MAPPMHLIVLVKGVPDIQLERHLDEQLRLQRPEGVLSELDEYPVEAALELKEAYAQSAPEAAIVVSALSMGPSTASTALRKALQLGADEAFHLNDEALSGADIWVTSRALSAALGEVIARGAQKLGTEAQVLILSGMASEDSETAAVPAHIAEHLRLSFFSHIVELSLLGEELAASPGALQLRLARVNGVRREETELRLPAMITVTDQANTPRYPNFKAIMAAKKKPITTLTVAELGLTPADLRPKVRLLHAQQRPERVAGAIITDDGTAGAQLVDYLQKEHLV